MIPTTLNIALRTLGRLSLVALLVAGLIGTVTAADPAATPAGANEAPVSETPANGEFAAVDEELSDNKPKAGLASRLTITDYSVMALIILVGGAGAVLLKRRLVPLTGDTSMQDAFFEAQLLRQIEAAHSQDKPLEREASDEHPNDAAFIPLSIATTGITPDPVAPVQSDERSPARLIVRKLEMAGLIDQVEQAQDHHGVRDYAISVLLRNRRRVLIVSQHETPQFTAHNLKRYDLLIFATPSGAGVVVTKVEDLIAESLAGRF